MNECCQNCRFSLEFDATLVVCRRFPPVLHAEKIVWYQPYINKNIWCGEYSPRKTQETQQ